VVTGFIQEAIDEHFKLIMIRPDMVLASQMVSDASSNLQIGTVIDFPGGNSTVADKLFEAKKAIQDGADDLDYVCNYEAFKNGDIELKKRF
jgi:deoxyribose-phosphate aldolase